MRESYPALVLDSLEPVPVRLSFRLAVAHNLARRQFTDNVILMAVSGDHVTGWGECVPRTYVSGETPASVLTMLNRACPELAERSFDSPGNLIAFLDSFALDDSPDTHPAARCCLELALLDLAGRHWNMSVPDLLGLGDTAQPLIYSMVIPFLSERALAPFLDLVRTFGFSQVKVKVGADDPAHRVKAVRDCLGDGVELRVDTNCAWTRDSAPGFMRDLANLGVVSVEQPLAAGDYEGMALLRGPGLPAITLDESVCSIKDIEHIAATGAADIVNIRVSKCGGLIPSLKMIHAAAENGIGIQLGAQVGESSILSAAGAHLAAGTAGFRWLEGAFGGHLLLRGLCETELQFGKGGRLIPPGGPGLGVTIERPLVDAAAADYHDLSGTTPDTPGPCAAADWGQK